DGHSNPDFLRPVHDAAPGGGTPECELLMDPRFVAAGHGGANCSQRFHHTDQHFAADHGRNQLLDDAFDTEKRGSHSATNDDVHADHLHRLLLQLCSGSRFVLYNTEPVDRAAAIPEPEATHAYAAEGGA